MANSLRSILGIELADVSDFMVYKTTATVSWTGCSVVKATLTSTTSATWQTVASGSGSGVLQFAVASLTAGTTGLSQIRLSINGVVITTVSSITPSTSLNRPFAFIGNVAVGGSSDIQSLLYDEIPFEGGWSVEVYHSTVTTRTWELRYRYYNH